MCPKRKNTQSFSLWNGEMRWRWRLDAGVTSLCTERECSATCDLRQVHSGGGRRLRLRPRVEYAEEYNIHRIDDVIEKILMSYTFTRTPMTPSRSKVTTIITELRICIVYYIPYAKCHTKSNASIQIASAFCASAFSSWLLSLRLLFYAVQQPVWIFFVPWQAYKEWWFHFRFWNASLLFLHKVMSPIST